MIIVTIRSYLINGFGSQPFHKYEQYRLINTVFKDGTVVAVLERLFDYDGKKKGDLFTMNISYLSVLHNSSSAEDDLEREKYLNEIKSLIHDKNN